MKLMRFDIEEEFVKINKIIDENKDRIKRE